MSVDVVAVVVSRDEYYSMDEPQTITASKFSSICRTCMRRGDIKSIFDLVYEQVTVQDLLLICGSVQVYQGDYLPQNICSECLEELIRCYTFKQKCHESERLLKNIYNKEVADISLRLIRKQDVHEECNYSAENVDNKHLVIENSIESNIEDVNLQSTECKIEVSLPDNVSDLDNGIQADESKYSDCSNDSETSHSSNIKPEQIVRKKVKMKPLLRKARRSKPPEIPQNSPFKCRDCSETYDTRDELKEHRKVVKHPEIRNHTCSYCKKKFTSSKLRQHMRVHTKEKPFICKICSQGFSMSGNLKRHMMTHTGERPHVCQICGKGFIQATTLQIHRRTHGNIERGEYTGCSANFICNHCGRNFKRYARYNAHLKKHINENNDSKKNLEAKETKEYTCEICKRAYKTKHLLKAHQLTHGEKSFLCSDCGKGFVTKAALLSHFKIHTGERPHTCTVCKKSFAHVGSFEAHMLIHTGQKPYNCTVCSKAFTQLSHLKYHLRTHSGERPYICSYCGKSFALKGNLTVHVRIHTGETPYLCPVCGKGFYDSSSMKKHRRGHGEIFIAVPDLDLGGNQIVPNENHI